LGESTDAYGDAGVDVTRGYRALDLMRSHIEATQALKPAGLPGVVGGVGGFAGLFDIGGGRLLAAGADGVGTKLKLATLAGWHDTIGIDCVAMCVNDVACCGAQPLFFLDYIASGRTDPERVADVVAGVANGCTQAGCALLGGETAEMPGFYAGDDYDLAGFAVGIVDKDKLWDGKANTKAGDVLIGLTSSGPHSNGFSLIRRVFSEERLKSDQELLDALLAPTRIYVKELMALQASPLMAGRVHGAAHITGGGFFENIPRMLAPGLSARIERSALGGTVFDEIAKAGNVSEHDMFATFNMGIGLVVAIEPDELDTLRDDYDAVHNPSDAVWDARDVIFDAGGDPVIIGEIVPGDGEVLFV